MRQNRKLKPPTIMAVMIGPLDGETSPRASHSNKRIRQSPKHHHSQAILIYLILEASTYQLLFSQRPSQTSSPWRCQFIIRRLRSNQWQCRHSSIRWISSHSTTAIKIKWAPSRCISSSSKWGNWVSKQVKREILMFKCRLCSKYSRCSYKCRIWWGACRWVSRCTQCPRWVYPLRRM